MLYTKVERAREHISTFAITRGSGFLKEWTRVKIVDTVTTLKRVT